MIDVARPTIDNREIAAVTEVMQSGNYASGKKVEEFEKRFADYIGVNYAVACNSGTAALHMTLIALGAGTREVLEEVIVPPISFFATVSPILMVGAVPSFVDVDEYCNLDPKKITISIMSETTTIIPVHLFGHPCQIKEIMEVAKAHNLLVIEDCAQAHGASVDGQKVGSFGDAGCFSFFATKNITTFEGGMITTNRVDVYETCKKLRAHGMVDRHTHSMLGYNYKMTEISAAVGTIQLARLLDLNEIRIQNSKFLARNIENQLVDQLYQFDSKGYTNVYFWFPVVLDGRNMTECFLKHLEKNDVGYRFRYFKPLTRQPIFKKFRHECHQEISMAKRFAGSVVGLPNYPGLTKEELKKVVEVVNNFEY